MTALGATEEANFTFVGCTELAEPPDGKVIFALGAFYLDGRHRLYLTFLFHDDNLILTALNFAPHLIAIINLTDITAFPAF